MEYLILSNPLNFGESVALMHRFLKKKKDANTAVCVNNLPFCTAASVQMKHQQGEWRVNLTFHSWWLYVERLKGQAWELQIVE